MNGGAFGITIKPQSRAGRPLIFIAGLIGAWIFARMIVILATPTGQVSVQEFIPKVSRADIQPFQPIVALPVNDESVNIASDINRAPLISYLNNDDFGPVAAEPFFANSGFAPTALFESLFVDAVIERSSVLAREKISPSHLNRTGKWGSIADIGAQNSGNQDLDAGRADASRIGDLGSKWSAYGYIFGRSGSGSANALGARYGGSQAALQAAYRINSGEKIGWDAVVRVQTALNSDDKELAAGVRVKPLRTVPISVIAEHRFRPSSADGFAFYAAGGKSAIELPIDFKLNIYGQAGLSTAGDDTLFFDAQAVAERPIHTSGNVTVSAGAGAWGGGQSDAQRLDVGPSVSFTLSSGNQNYRLSGDWRERVSGNAAPDSGVAITLSTDF